MKSYGVCNKLVGLDGTNYLIACFLTTCLLHPTHSTNYLIVSLVVKSYGVCNLLQGRDYNVYLIALCLSSWHFESYPVSELVNSLPSSNGVKSYGVCKMPGGWSNRDNFFNSLYCSNPPWYVASYPVSELVKSP